MIVQSSLRARCIILLFHVKIHKFSNTAKWIDLSHPIRWEPWNRFLKLFLKFTKPLFSILAVQLKIYPWFAKSVLAFETLFITVFNITMYVQYLLCVLKVKNVNVCKLSCLNLYVAINSLKVIFIPQFIYCSKVTKCSSYNTSLSPIRLKNIDWSTKLITSVKLVGTEFHDAYLTLKIYLDATCNIHPLLSNMPFWKCSWNFCWYVTEYLK